MYWTQYKNHKFDVKSFYRIYKETIGWFYLVINLEHQSFKEGGFFVWTTSHGNVLTMDNI